MLAFGKILRSLTPRSSILFAMVVVTLVAAPVPTLISTPCAAQRKKPFESSRGIFLPSSRLDSRGIQRAKELIAAGEFSQAIRFLDKVLAREEDSFIANPVTKMSEPGSLQVPAGNRPKRGVGGPAQSKESAGGPDQGNQGAKNVRDAEPQLKDSQGGREHTGLKETARQMLRDLPPEGRRIYESTFGPAARRLLAQSIEKGNFQQLRQITHRYFYTPAGHEAALLFAQYEADRGRHLTAALTYQQLLESSEASARFQPQLSVLGAISWLAADNPSRAATILERLGELGFRNIELSGKDYPLRASQSGMVDWFLQTVGTPVIKDAVAELQWLTSRGNPARNGQADGGLPHLRVRWQVRLLEHHNLEAVHEEMAEVFTRQQKSRLPAATPLAVGDYVITRSAHGLIAIDFKTGKRIWQAQPQREALHQDLMDGNYQLKDSGSDIEPAQAFARTIWEDYLYNTTSSDGQRVYVIRDLTLPKLDHARFRPFNRSRSAQPSNADTNRLCAYDLPTQGKLVWEIDGAARNDVLQGAFFLGAPVTVGRSVYCLVEIKSETAIYLIALDRQTGDLQWRQQLADLETGIALDTPRRLRAVIPSYDGGMLICPTGAGVVVGVDLAKQALAWAYSYKTKGRPTRRLRMPAAKRDSTDKQWVHSAPVIADGRVLLTPPESSMLHCLDLVTGELLWRQPRGATLFLAGVEGGRVLLVGNNEMSALRLADGRSAWSSKNLALPAGSVPTGSGFFSNGRYFLPLSNAEVIAVDVAQGKIVDKTSSRDGQLLGNLICYRGAVISQTGRFLDCFEQVDVLQAKSERRRAQNPTDAEALRTLGEIAYNEGQLAQAIELLSKAYDSEPDDLRTREVLGEALVAALDEDFAQYQHQLPLLAQLQHGSAAAQLTLLRLQSQGLLSLGQATAAFDACLEAYELISNKHAGTSPGAELLIGRDHRVGVQSWLAAQVAAAWAAASQDQRQQIVEQFTPLLEQTRRLADANLWRHFYDCFGTLELTESLGIELAANFVQQGNLLAAQQLLLRLQTSDNREVSNAAIAYSSRILHASTLAHLAMPVDAKLRGPLANQECLPGRSGLECLAEWASNTSGAKNRADADNKRQPTWPYGRVEWSLEESTLQRKANRSPHTAIQIERSDDVLGGCNVTLVGVISGRNREIMVRDSLGRDFFRATLDRRAQSVMNFQGSVYGVARGNLLILSLGREIVAYDTLSKGHPALWRMSATSDLQYFNRGNVAPRFKLGNKRISRSQSDGNWIGVIGPVTSNSCVFQKEQRLLCVDSLSGEIKWSRSNLPLGCDLFGDEQHVFAVAKDAKQALVFSAIDGRSLGETVAHLPIWEERLATVGRKIIRWRKRDDDEGRWELSAIDPLTGEAEWTHDFDKNAQVDVERSRFVAVAESTGNCVVVDISNGTRVVDQRIETNFSLSEVHLSVGSDHFVLALQEPLKVDSTRRVAGFNRVDFTQPFAGQIYLFDRVTGEAVWDRPADVQGLPLMLAQGVDLPVIAFAGNLVRQDKQGSKREIGIMLLEKSSGRLLFHDETLPQSANHFFVKAAENMPHEVVVEMLTRKIKIRFTDGPRAPEPPAMHDVQRHKRTGPKGLQKIGELILRGG